MKSWKSITKPSISAWLTGVSESLAMEKLTFTLKSKYPIFEDMWRSFMLLLEGRKALEAYSPLYVIINNCVLSVSRCSFLSLSLFGRCLI